MPIITKQITSSYNDWGINEAGTVTYPSSTFFGSVTQNIQLHCFRFLNIEIPQGVTINSAKITLVGMAEFGTPPTSATIYAEKVPAAKIGTRIITSASFTVSSAAWASMNFSSFNTPVDSPDFASVVQEIVNQTDWVSGNPINIIIDTGAGFTGLNTWELYEYTDDPARAATLTIDFSYPPSIENTSKPKTKTFFHKVYDKDGNYLTTWAKDVISKPEFSWKMNGGMGEMIIKLKRELKDYEEGTNITVGNVIKTYVQDGDREIGTKIWEGLLNRYEPTVLPDGSQGVLIRCVSHTITQQYRIVRDPQNNTTVAYASTDPTNIFKSLINSKWNNGILKVGTMDLTGTTVSYTFRGDTFMSAYDIIVKLSPQYWYWYLDAENFVHFKEANFEEVNHKLILGKHIIRMNITKSIENMVNRVLFMGGGSPPLYEMYERTGSQTEWGLRELFIKDERVTVSATAELIATSHMDIYDHPISVIEIEVIDSNIDPVNGFDLERLKPGDIIQIFDPDQENAMTLWDQFDWDVGYWDFDITKSIGQPQQIKEIKYGFNTATLYLSEKSISLEKRMEDINRNLETTAKLNLPAQPS